MNRFPGKYVWLLAIFAQASVAFSQDGGQIYTTYCGACHGPEGQGQPVAGIPPLAGSRWAIGDPRRSIQSVLHGLMGPIEVNGKAYNSMMPAQGLVLSDAQLAAALTYVRSNWGNKESEKVTPGQVAAERKRTAQRTAPWEAIELLKQFPLPKEEVLLTRIEATFQANEDADPRVIPNANLPQNLLSMKAAGEPMKTGSILEFTGEMTVPREDNYTLYLGSTFETLFKIDGKTYLKQTKKGSTRSPKEIKLSLKEGTYPFSLRLKRLRSDDMVFSWKSEQSPVMKSLIYGDKSKAWETVELIPSEELYFYRGSIDQGGSGRTIAVGSPAKLHFVFDPITAAPTLLWSGRFIDAGRHWSNRGSGLESPMGRAISQLVPGLAWQLRSPSEWPLYDVNEKDIDIRNRLIDYLGYQLDRDRLGVTFRYLIGKQEIEDHYRPTDGKTLLRTITNLGDNALFLKLLEREAGAEVSKESPFVIDQSSTIEATSSPLTLQWIPQDPVDKKSPPRKAGIAELAPGTELSLVYRRN